MSSKIKYYLLGLLLVGTAIAFTTYYNYAMAILIPLSLAYLTKGMKKPDQPR